MSAAGKGRASAAVARVYARALARLAGGDAEQEAEWLEAVRTLVAASDCPAWREMLSAPGYSRARRAELLIELAGDLLNDKAARLTELLASFDRLGPEQIAAIESALVRELDLLHGRAEVQVQTARPVDEDEKAQIEKAMQRRFGEDGALELEIHYSTDPALVEGLIATCGDRRIDASVRGQLQRLTAAARAGG